MLEAIEKASGMRLVTCPWQSLRDPLVQHVMRAHRWYRERQLEAAWGGDVPAVIVRALEIYDGAVNATQLYDMRARQKREKEESDRQFEAMDPSAGRKLYPRKRR